MVGCLFSSFIWNLKTGGWFGEMRFWEDPVFGLQVNVHREVVG